MEKVDPGTRLDIYLQEFRRVNPGKKEPLVDYKNGWWCWRDTPWSDPYRRMRTIDFELITQTLAARPSGAVNQH